MSNENQSYLRFSLEESVWFQKGQEVDELISISLDPNITIQETDQYVTIKGSLDLTGEYNREKFSLEEDIDDDISSPKTVQSIDVREDGLYLFSHQFPVEVTIPKNRIQELNDINVTVETFDYAFPERSCIRLSADLMITGLYGEQQHELYEEQQHELYGEQQHEYGEQQHELYGEQQHELYGEQQHELYGEQQRELYGEQQRELYGEQQHELHGEEMVEEELIEIEPIFRDPSFSDENWSYTQSPFNRPGIPNEDESELYTPFEVEARKNPQDTEQDNDTSDQQQEFVNRQEENEDNFINQHEEYTGNVTHRKEEVEDFVIEEEIDIELDVEQNITFEEEYPEITYGSNQNAPVGEDIEYDQEDADEDTSDQQDEKKSKKKWKNKKSLTLSEFFARKSEEDHIRLKMCIVQSGETLDILSERYDVPVSQLQRVNRIELNQDIYEGQVLYIPISLTQR